MAGSPSWAPHLRGDALPPFPSLTESIDRDSVPTRREHSGWTQAAFAKWFPSNAFDEALWDTVLALWRLYYDVNKDADKDLWDKYVLAYLRRHYVLCNGRPPLPSVRDFAAELGQHSGFPIDHIPSGLRGIQTDNIPADLGDQPAGPGNHTEPPHSPFKDRTATSQIEDRPAIESIPATKSTDGEEQETIDQLMDDTSTGLEDDPAAHPKPKKRKTQAYVQVPPRSPASKSRAVTSRPQHNPGRSPKKSTTVRPPRPGDLQHISVHEDSTVDTKMLPRWEDKPCKQCSMTKTKSKSCVPLWRYPDNKRKVGSMWCSNCRENGEPDCSFVPSKLGVRHLPTITPTEAGNTRRQLEASTPTPSPQSSRQDASHRTSKPSIRFPPSSSTAVSSGSGKHQGQVETIILGDFVSFEDILRDANRSSLSLEAARIEIRSMMSREIGSLKVLTKTIEERQQALSHLESRFTRDITRLRAEEGGGVPSLSEGVNVTPGEEQQPSVGRRSKVVVRVMSVVPDSEEE